MRCWLMSVEGQNAKYSLRADVFCCASNNGHRSIPPPCRKSANSGSRGHGLLDQITRAARRDSASLWKSCFAEPFDKHLRPPVTATSYPFGCSEIGLNLKKLGHRLPGFCISPQVRERCREAEMRRRKGLVPLESVLGRGNRLIETTNADERNGQSCKP